MATGLPAPAGRRIALIAHDNKKQDMLEWAEYNLSLLAGHELFATATTGRLVHEQLGLRGGELVAVMGPSGSGKSSLLTIAGSLEEPTRGQVLVMGTDLSHLSPNDQARLRRRLIGYVFQDFNLLAGFTAIENVTVPMELDGTSAKAARATGMKALAELGMAKRAHHFPDELSGGERQRVAIARAVVGDRRLLLADEPTGALDSVNAEAVMLLMLAICRRGVAGVVVTHDPQMASCADRVVLLQDGQVIDQAQTSPGPDSLLTPDAQR